MSDKPLIIDARLGEKNYKEIKANEVLNFLMRYSKIQWDKGRRRTRQLFPELNIISKNCHLEDNTTKMLVDYLEEKGEIIRDVSQRYLKWVWQKLQEQKEKKEIEKKNKMNFTNKDEFYQDDKDPFASVLSIPSPSIQKKETEKKKNLFERFLYILTTLVDKFKIVFLKSIMLFIACITTYTSIVFTYLWFMSMFDFMKSLLLSVAIVGTSITSFEMVVLFKQDRRYLMVVLFSILWIGVVTFSITTGLSGQVNLEIQKKIMRDESNIKDSSQLLLYNDYMNRIKDIKIEIESIRREREKLQEILSGISYDNTSDRKEYNNINYRISLKNNEINKLRKELDELEIKKEELIKEDVKVNITRQIDFFEWLESIFKIRADKFRFALYLILAIFVDIIAPLNFSIVLFYKRRII